MGQRALLKKTSLGHALHQPVVERPVVLELERADRVANTLNGVREGVRVVVEGVDAPLAARAVVVGMPNSVEHGVAHIDIGRGHVDLRAKDMAAIGKVSLSHGAKEFEALGLWTSPKWGVSAGLCECAAKKANVVRGLGVHIGMARLNECLCKLIQLFEVVAGKVMVRTPVESEPTHRLLDGIDKLLVFFCGVGVVEPKMTAAGIALGQAKVQADGFGVAEMEIAIGLGRKASNEFFDTTSLQVVFNDVSEEVLCFRGCGGSGHDELFWGRPDFTGRLGGDRGAIIRA